MFVYKFNLITVRVVCSAMLFLILSPLALSQQQVTVPAGLRLVVAPTATLRTGDIKTGDRFTVTLVTDLVFNGELAAHRGDTVSGTVVRANKARRVAGKAQLELQLDSIHTEGNSVLFKSVVWGVEGERSNELKKTAGKVAIGKAVGGASMAKRMLATSSAIAILTPGKQIEVAEGMLMEFYLAEPRTMPLLANVSYSVKDTALSLFQDIVNKKLTLQVEYGWTREVTIAKDGKVKSNNRVLVRHDSLGNQTEELIGVQKKGKRGIRGRIQKKISKKMAELVAGIQKLLNAYSLAVPKMSKKFFARAVTSHASGDMTGTIQFEDIDVVSTNDWATIWFDSSTMSPRKLLFKTFMGEKAVQGEVTYVTIDDSFFEIGKADVRIPGEGLAITITNNDFHKIR